MQRKNEDRKADVLGGTDLINDNCNFQVRSFPRVML